MTWALRSLYRPSARAHLPTTCQGAMVVLPDGSRAPSGGGSAGVSFPAGIYQQTPTAACASDAAAPIIGGLGAFSHQQAAQGIYRCIACYYYVAKELLISTCYNAILCYETISLRKLFAERTR